MKPKDLRGSITVAEDAKKKKKPVEDDNPEGVNQWSSGAAAALKASQERHAASGHKQSGKEVAKAEARGGRAESLEQMKERHNK
jgi:hypothetical protein